MIECTVTDESGIKWITIRGRIDSMTSPQIQQRIGDLVQCGERLIVADLEGVSYLSSAGLRIFTISQKQLRKADGEIVLYRVPPQIVSVFELSGLLSFFRVASCREEIAPGGEAGGSRPATVSKQIEGISFQIVPRQAAAGELRVIGSQEQLPRAGYRERDVVAVQPGELRFGTGLAALGDHYEEYKSLFGESIVVEHSLYFFPAVKRPAVDFMLFSGGPGAESHIQYRFLHGFGFSGALRYVASFEGTDAFVELEKLVSALFAVSDSNLLGLVFLAESKGLWGMHLKRVPISENRPSTGEEIFHASNFSEWMSFPVEPSDINHIVLGVGVAARSREAASSRVRSILPQGSSFHVHGGVFPKEPLSRRIEQFEPELVRIAAELDISKVEHLLGQSLFGNGIIGIIELSE